MFTHMEMMMPDVTVRSEKETGGVRKRFIYVDHSESREGTLVFQCDADSIIAADEMYRKEIGKDPAKRPHVGCSMERLEHDDDI